METREAPLLPPMLHRTNTDLNLSVLRRHRPNIETILSQAANAVVYIFSAEEQEWHKHGVEGTMFVCQQEPLVLPNGQVIPQSCVFIMNRRSLTNLVVDLIKVSHCEVAGDLIILKLQEGEAFEGVEEEGGDAKVLGLWVHADKQDTREVNAVVIEAAWNSARAAVEQLAQTIAAGGNPGEYPTEASEARHAQESQGAGRRLSITDLFGQNNGHG